MDPDKKLIVDANIIISSLIKKSSRIRDILLDEEFLLFSPEFVLDEISKNKWKIAKFSELSDDEVDVFVNRIFKNIRFVTTALISKENLELGFQLCKEVDEKDTVYVALAIELNGLLWTGDKKLVKGLLEKGYQNTISTDKISHIVP